MHSTQEGYRVATDRALAASLPRSTGRFSRKTLLSMRMDGHPSAHRRRPEVRIGPPCRLRAQVRLQVGARVAVQPDSGELQPLARRLRLCTAHGRSRLRGRSRESCRLGRRRPIGPATHRRHYGFRRGQVSAALSARRRRMGHRGHTRPASAGDSRSVAMSTLPSITGTGASSLDRGIDMASSIVSRSAVRWSACDPTIRPAKHRPASPHVRRGVTAPPSRVFRAESPTMPVSESCGPEVEERTVVRRFCLRLAGWAGIVSAAFWEEGRS